MSEKILLIDGNHAVHRAYFSVPDNMTAPTGEKTNAVHGFFQILLKAVEKLDVDSVIVCWDWGKPVHRTEALPEYKSNREPMKDSLKEQFPIIRELLNAINVGQIGIQGQEADDIIGTLSRLNRENGDETYILSGDRDMFQLVNEKVKVVRPVKGGELVIYDENRVEEEYGVQPSRYIDLVAMRGDSSDCITGIPGIGEKTAVKLMQEYKTLDKILLHMKDIKGKVGEMIRENWEQALLSRDIARININLELDKDFDDNHWGNFTEYHIKEYFGKYNLNSAINRLLKHCEGGRFNKNTVVTVAEEPVIIAPKKYPEEQDRLF